MNDAPLIVLAAGGTGGHIFPAEALARELRGRGWRVALITDRRGSRFGEDIGVPIYRIEAATLGGGIVSAMFGAARMALGVLQARYRLLRLQPSAVVGFGGYPSVPTLYAAVSAGLPIVLHEQNAVLGRANRALMRQARLIAAGFPQVTGFGPTAPRVVHTGNPVRARFAALRAQPYVPPSADGPIRLFVMGGSQGARVFSDVVPRALALLPGSYRRRITIAQQCRAEDLERARAGYAAAGIEPDLAPFFQDAPERLASCHLAICRAGASTIAELAMLGRPALLVPYPHGHAGEQTANAQSMAEAGGAWVIPQDSFTSEALAARLDANIAQPALLEKTAIAARACGRPDAAAALADCVRETIETGPQPLQVRKIFSS